MQADDEGTLGYANRSIEELIKLLSDPDPSVRAEARRHLSARPLEVIPKLLEALEAASEETRFEISKALTEIGEPALEPMMKAILHPNTHVREAAARVLSLIGGEDARRRLDEAAYTEKRKTVRKELREAAAKIARKLESLDARYATHPSQVSAQQAGEADLARKEQEEKKLYLSIVRNVILSNWAKPGLFSEGTRGEEVLVTLKLERDGSVSRVLIENKWQNTPFGESLKDAIRRSSPLPPVPETLAGSKKEIDLTFILRAPS
jgi:hypothetical protein